MNKFFKSNKDVSVCKKECKGSPGLKSHSKVHLPAGEREKFKCSHCSKEYYNDKVRLKHIQVKHPVAPSQWNN